MLKKLSKSIIFLMIIILASCVVEPPKPDLTPLQIQLMQTKVFNVNKRSAFNSTVTVMQNLGYIIHDANFDTGIITAQSTQTVDFWQEAQYTEATAFIQKYRGSKKDSSIRINFVVHKTVPNPSQQSSVPIHKSTAVVDPQAYKNAFTKIQQQIFIDTGVSPVLDQPIQQTV